MAGANVTLAQDDALKTITIAASGGGGGFHAWTFTDPAETIGEPSLGLLSGSTYSSFTTSVLLGRAIRISDVLWVVGVAETWTLKIDGVVVATASSIGGTETIAFNAGGLVVAAGQHNFALSPSTNSQMHYVADFTFIDRWLRIEGWVELSGDYHAPLQLVCEPGSLTAF